MVSAINVEGRHHEGYNQLRRLGDVDGLKQACDELGKLFSRTGVKPGAVVTAMA